MSTHSKTVATAGLTDNMHPSAWLCAAVMLGIMSWGSYQTLHVLSNGKNKNIPWTAKDALEGPTTAAINAALDKQMPGREDLITLANSGRYLLLSGAGDDVRLGQDGWLFLTEEIRYQPDVSQRRESRVQLIAQVAAAMQSRQIELSVALVPDKARVYEKQLGSNEINPAALQRQQDLAARLMHAGVKVVNLQAPLQTAAMLGADQQTVYYRSDTHWNQTGAQIAAQHIAQQLSPLVKLQPNTTFRTTQPPSAAPRPGDLLRLMGLDKAPGWMRPPLDLESPASTQADASATSAPAKGLSLLGDAGLAEPPVVLLGTSYSQRGNFHGYLQQALQAQVLNMSKDGGGLLQSASDYFKDDAFKTSPPQLIVWEIPERMFDLPPEKDESNWFKKLGL
jgi:alginate O-acetyltransferase complex protein AlgJ